MDFEFFFFYLICIRLWLERKKWRLRQAMSQGLIKMRSQILLRYLIMVYCESFLWVEMICLLSLWKNYFIWRLRVVSLLLVVISKRVEMICLWSLWKKTISFEGLEWYLSYWLLYQRGLKWYAYGHFGKKLFHLKA